MRQLKGLVERRKKPLSTRKVGRILGVSKSTAQRALRADFGLYSYKKRREPKLTELHKLRRRQF